ncbi:MAG: transposase [candidate division WOR-3 bacterium]|nr:transposase [candidate division WOR-3 bacterium]
MMTEISNVGQGFSLAGRKASYVGQGFSLAGRKASDVGQGFSLAKKPRYKKRIRLKNFDYKGTYRYFVTLCTANKRKIFVEKSLVESLLQILRKTSKFFGFKVWAYCFMPDHLHLLVEGVEEAADFRKFIEQYKQRTGFYYKKLNRQNLWQIGYYDHVLRKDEDTILVAQYIFGNPERQGLVDDYKDYEFLGSFEFDVKQT